MNSKSFKLLLSVFLFIGIISNSFAQITPHEAILQIQKGINLGNTHEPPTEAGWNNPKAQEYYFDMYKDAGFQCVRIPVRWDNYTGKTPPYAVSTVWLNRIEQVVEWGLSRDMFIVINSHHDNWIKDNYSEANKARFDSIWTQIADRFKDKPEKLIFEVLNEPHGLNKTQNDDMHARILSIIRKTNPTRLVIFQGHNWGSSEDLLEAAIPDDDYIIGSFHSYDPWPFGLEGTGTFGGNYDYNQLDTKFKTIDDWSKENNIPVFLGEFGSKRIADYNSRMRHYRAYVELSQKYGFASAAWDDGGDFRIMEREQHDWNEVKDILIHTTVDAPDPRVDVYQDSIVRVRWANRVLDHDSIIIQRRLGTENHYTDIAVLPPDSILYYDIKPAMSKYYSYRAIANYSDTTDLFSQPFQVFFPTWVKAVRIPFYDTLQVIPGIVEAEDFDKGGEGLSYHDADLLNVGGDYRPDEGVDIYERLGDGYHVGNAINGEWYEYSVNVKTEGWYDVTTYVAALYGGGTFQISVDTVKSDILTALTCYSWLNTKPITTKMYLYTGEQIVRFSVLGDPLFNIDKMIFELTTNVSNLKNQIEFPFTVFQQKNGGLIVKQLSNTNIETIDLYNLSGALFRTFIKPGEVTQIPTYDIPTGIYVIHATSKNGRYSRKIVIK